MTTDPLGPFDAHLHWLHTRRAARHFAKADFLHQLAATDLTERLSSIRRDFQDTILFGSHANTLQAALHRDNSLASRLGTRNLIGDQGNQPTDWTVELAAVPPASVDLVTSLLEVHWVNDVPGLFAQARRVLRPDGLFLVNLIGGNSLQELRACLWQAETETLGRTSLRLSPMAQAQDLAGLLQRAGFALPVADSDVHVVRYQDMFALLRDIRAMGETSALRADLRPGPLARAVLLKAAELYQTKFADPDGRVRATVEILTATGWAPHESQQKPLKPGSAQVSLTEILGSGRPQDDDPD